MFELVELLVGYHLHPMTVPSTNYPARACASKGLCDRSWCLLYIVIYISAKLFFYLSKYSLSDAHFNTGRLLFEFNRLLYTLAAPEVFVSSANPVSLPSGYRVSIVRNTNIDQIETTPLRYCMLQSRAPPLFPPSGRESLVTNGNILVIFVMASLDLRLPIRSLECHLTR